MPTKKRVSKTVEVLIIQGNHGYGHGWEDESEYDKSDRKSALADLKEYRASGHGPYRLITRRIKREPSALRNPSTTCSRVSAHNNAYQGRTVVLGGSEYEVKGCGTGEKRVVPVTQGTYALRNLQTGKVKYVKKSILRDLKYRHGGAAVLGAAEAVAFKRAEARREAQRKADQAGRKSTKTHALDADLALLDLSRLPSEAGLKAAWRKVAKRTHPDAGGSQRAFVAAQAAHKRLQARVKRAAAKTGR